MDGITKLRYGLTAMLILFTISLVSSYFVAIAEEDAAINAIGKLSFTEQDALIKYANMLPDYTGVYTLIGWLAIAVEIGLIIATWKVWHVEEIRRQKKPA